MDLFVIDTPLQLLNAIEVRHHFGIGPSPLLILKWKFWPKIAFERLLNEIEWKEIIWFEMDAIRPAFSHSMLAANTQDCINEYVWTWRQYLRRRNLEKTLSRFGSVKRLIAGSLINLGYMCHVVNYVSSSEIIAVDDGTFTLDVAALRREKGGNINQTPSLGFIKSVKKVLRKRYVEWDTQQPRSVRFFTAYDVSFGPEDYVVTNKYEWLRAKVIGSSTNGQIYFLGQPLIEDGYLTEATYFYYLEKITSYLGRENMFYLPHKRESARTVSIVESKLKLPIKRFNEPIEIAIGNALPSILASFHCSALESCAMIFGDTFRPWHFTCLLKLCYAVRNLLRVCIVILENVKALSSK